MAEFITIRGDRHVVSQCKGCGVWFTIPELVYQARQEQGGFNYCPNGHAWGWKTGAEKEAEAQRQAEHDEMRRERDRLKQDAARLAEEIAAQRVRAEMAEREAARMRRRVSAGVCMCCNRSFLNLRRHMAVKHPDIVPREQKGNAQ